MSVLIKYDATLTVSGCSPHVMLAQAAEALGLDPATVNVSIDKDPEHRTAGEEIWVVVPDPLDEVDLDALDDVVMNHSASDTVIQTTVMRTNADGQATDGAECWVDTSAGVVTIRLPKIGSTAKGVDLKRVGINDLVIKPHVDDEGGVLVDGLASVVVSDGAPAHFGPDGTGWTNRGQS